MTTSNAPATTTIQEIKNAIIEFNKWTVKANDNRNSNYSDIANTKWVDNILPFVKNENITTWEKDIQDRFINNPYCRLTISEKQAYCLARAYAAINPTTIK